MYRQRLHLIAATVPVGEIFQHTLIYSPAHSEAESRVKAIFHVFEILVGQQLEKHGRGGRGT